MEHYGVLTLIPAFGFLVLALVTRKTITSIVISGLAGYFIYYKFGFVVPSLEALVDACTDWDNCYIVVICLLFGCLVQLLRAAKGPMAFGDLVRRYANTQKKTLIATWIAGLIIFIDDYLSILVTANTILPVADEHKTPREMLCYVINTTSAPVCVIIPISAWVVFFSGIFEAQPETAVIASTGMGIYYKIMPYFFYPFVCVIFVPLVILGIVPLMGGMKKAYQRVEETGKLWPPSSDIMNKDSLTGTTEPEVSTPTGAIASKEEAEREFEPRLWTFLVPMIIVIAITIWQGDILIGVAAGIVSCLLYIPAGIMSFGKFCDMCYKGLEDMLFIGVVLVTSLFYRESMLLVGLPEFIIEVAGPFMSAALLPAIVFIVVGLICFATGNIWSIPAVTTPIVVPLAVAVGAHLPLTLGAIISAAVFGAQACFYSDVVLLSASACKVNNVDYCIAQLPYIIIVAAMSTVFFLIAGFVLAV
ncbi:MAG: sodium:proton antiporter [Clostridiales bacterium]|nr:sodium:proton antiporter [Clostridiales bacterium]